MIYPISDPNSPNFNRTLLVSFFLLFTVYSGIYSKSVFILSGRLLYEVLHRLVYVIVEAQGHPDRPNSVIYSLN